MTLNAGDARDEYTAAAGQTVFNYTFKIYESTDLDVYVTPAGQECSPADLTTSYTVAGVGAEAGGTITLTTPSTDGDLVTIVSSIPTSRTTDYQNNGDFRPDTVNDDFDRVVSLVKQIQDIADRSLQFTACLQGATSLSLPVPVSGELMRWKTDLTGLENVAYPTNLLNAVSEDVSIVDGQLSYSVITGGLSLIGARVELAKAGGATDGTLLVAGTDYTVTGDQTFDLLQSYPSGVLRVSSIVSGFSATRTFINVKDYGATGNGVTDDTSAISSALTAAVSNGEAVYFPAGDYLVSSKISKDISGGDLGLTMFGDGISSTRIQCSSATGTFAITSSLSNTVEVRGLGFIPVGADRGTAVEVLATPGSGNPYLTLSIERCHFGAINSTDSDTNHFTTGIDYGGTAIGQSWGTGIIRDCFFQGRANADPDKMTAINIRHANDLNITGCFAYNCLYAVYSDSFTPEGIQVRDNFFIRCNTGVRLHSADPAIPYIRISSNHISYSYRAIDLKNHTQSYIQSNLILCRSDSTQTTTNDILMENCNNSIITDNFSTLTAAGVTTQKGYEFIGGTLLKVKNNSFKARDSGVSLTDSGGSFTTNSVFESNTFDSMLTADQEYVVSSASHTGNEFKGRELDFRTRGTIASSQTLTTAVAATVEFGSLLCNVASLQLTTTATPGELQVPDGIESLRLEASLRVASIPSTSELLIVVEVDSGGGFTEVASRSYAGTSTGQYHIDTRPVGVSGGDLLRVRVTQDSGSNKTLSNNTARTTLNTYIL